MSNAIHELRTPLVAIRGYSKLILEEQTGPINDKQREFLQAVLANANRLVDVLNGLSRVTSDPLQLSLAPCDIRSLWQKSVELTRLPAQRKAVALLQKSSPGCFVVLGDREKLLLVFCKLLAHAIKIAKPGSAMQVEFSQADERISLRILGLSANGDEVLPGAATGKPGFSLARDIVWQHGGRLSATNSPEHGFALTLAFPVIDTTKEQNAN
jgi:signal transduction histidine kinase